MVKIYKQPFAHEGDTIAIPDASQPDGKMSNSDGWTPDYQLPKTDPNYKPVGRQEMNGVFKEVTESLGEIQQFGFAKWQPITWPQGARVVEGGVVYRALKQTSQQPPHSDWVPDINSILHPSMTGPITLNGTTDNSVDLADIVPELALEIGDVIRIDTGAYNKLHTVESITDNSSIIVNYEHAGNRGNGSLKLPDFTGQATVTRIAKWFNAPLGLGQAWVNAQASRLANTDYTNSTGRTISIYARLITSVIGETQITGIVVNGVSAGEWSNVPAAGSYPSQGATAVVPRNAAYRVENILGGTKVLGWAELR